MIFLKKVLLIACLSVMLGLVTPAGFAQAELDIVPEEPVYTFGESLTLSADLQTTEEVEEVLVYLQLNGDSDLQVFPVQLETAGSLSATINLKESPIPGFVDIDYWYQVEMRNGDVYQSPVYSFSYQDNRNSWSSLSKEGLTVSWYAGDLEYGEELLNVAAKGVREIQERFEVFFPTNLDIYVYDDLLAMQDAVGDGGQYWMAGHAAPNQEKIFVTLPPGPDQRLEMERQIPHELMHIALNYTDAHAYANFPVWFNEGLASLVELYPNPEYQSMVENAYETGNLIPMAALCESFPSTTQQALLAYAQSASFTQFLYDQFGKPGFSRMMAAYASGMNCERGIEEALGSSITALEASWQRSSFTGVTLGFAFRELLPWLVLLVVVLAGPLILVGVMIKKRPGRQEYD